jgi:hypothetical protein
VKFLLQSAVYSIAPPSPPNSLHSSTEDLSTVSKASLHGVPSSRLPDSIDVHSAEDVLEAFLHEEEESALPSCMPCTSLLLCSLQARCSGRPVNVVAPR